jgi:hypothetical protein
MKVRDMTKDITDRVETESLEESIFKTLSHQKRRDILRFIGERKEATFTEIKNFVGIEDSPSLSYHLNALGRLVVQTAGKYRLSELGNDAYKLMCKTASNALSTSIISSLRKEIPLIIIANAVLWVAAIFSVSQFEGGLRPLAVYSFVILWFISNIMLYSILTKVGR